MRFEGISVEDNKRIISGHSVSFLEDGKVFISCDDPLCSGYVAVDSVKRLVEEDGNTETCSVFCRNDAPKRGETELTEAVINAEAVKLISNSSFHCYDISSSSERDNGWRLTALGEICGIVEFASALKKTLRKQE